MAKASVLIFLLIGLIGCESKPKKSKVSSVENLQKDTMDWAIKLAKRSPQALANTKKLMRESLSNSA